MVEGTETQPSPETSSTVSLEGPNVDQTAGNESMFCEQSANAEGSADRGGAESRGTEPIRTEARPTVNGLDDSEADRRATVDAYIDEVFRRTGKRVTRTDIWKSARYKTRTEFERWERKDRRATKTAHERFTGILTEKPHLK